MVLFNSGLSFQYFLKGRSMDWSINTTFRIHLNLKYVKNGVIMDGVHLSPEQYFLIL